MYKNRERENPVFANINLQGPCNYKCFFCLGKDIKCLKSNYLNVHFKKWKNFDNYLDICKKNNIKKIYLTGQNTDPLLYKYLLELIEYLKSKDFIVGIRTNGLLAIEKKKELESLNGTISYSVHSLNDETNLKITEVKKTINLNDINKFINRNYRIGIVVNRYNKNEIIDMIKELSSNKNIRYIQLRGCATDNRYDELKEDIDAYKEISNYIKNNFKFLRNFYKAEIYDVYGVEVTLWKTVETTINSFNYFTEGIISYDYFVVEGYEKCKKEM